MFNPPKLDTYLVVPESKVQEAADELLDDPTNSFARLLKAGAEFKEAGLTPIYLLEKDVMDLYVIAKETFGKKLH